VGRPGGWGGGRGGEGGCRGPIEDAPRLVRHGRRKRKPQCQSTPQLEETTAWAHRTPAEAPYLTGIAPTHSALRCPPLPTRRPPASGGARLTQCIHHRAPVRYVQRQLCDSMVQYGSAAGRRGPYARQALALQRAHVLPPLAREHALAKAQGDQPVRPQRPLSAPRRFQYKIGSPAPPWPRRRTVRGRARGRDRPAF